MNIDLIDKLTERLCSIWVDATDQKDFWIMCKNLLLQHLPVQQEVPSKEQVIDRIIGEYAKIPQLERHSMVLQALLEKHLQPTEDKVEEENLKPMYCEWCWCIYCMCAVDRC